MSNGTDAVGPSRNRDSDDALSPPPGNPRFPGVDGVRWLAASSIVVYHLAQSSGVGQGQTGPAALFAAGVGVFFVVSGFLLYRPFVTARVLGAPSIRYLPFMWRRLLRIVPLFWFVLTFIYLTAAWSEVTTREEFFAGAPWWQYYLFGQVYTSDASLGAIGQAWTLDVELSFYLLLPAWAAALNWLRRFGVGLRWEVGALLAAALASFHFANGVAASDDQYLLRTLPGTVYLFVPGMILALLSVEQQRRPDWRPAAVMDRYSSFGWIIAITVLVAAPLVGSPTFTTIGGVLIAIAVPLPALFTRPTSLPFRMLLLPAVAWGGLVSYGIYLWHRQIIFEMQGLGSVAGSPLGFAATFMVAMVLVTGVAAVTYRLIERPALRLKRRTFSGSPEEFGQSGPQPAGDLSPDEGDLRSCDLACGSYEVQPSTCGSGAEQEQVDPNHEEIGGICDRSRGQ